MMIGNVVVLKLRPRVNYGQSHYPTDNYSAKPSLPTIDNCTQSRSSEAWLFLQTFMFLCFSTKPYAIVGDIFQPSSRLGRQAEMFPEKKSLQNDI